MFLNTFFLFEVYTDFLAGPFGYNYPHARMFASSAMISPDELIIFGGCLSGGMTGGPCPSADSWLFSYTKNRWEKIDASNITPRSYSSMASLISDGYRKSAVMFSGLQMDKTIIVVGERTFFVAFILKQISLIFKYLTNRMNQKEKMK